MRDQPDYFTVYNLFVGFFSVGGSWEVGSLGDWGNEKIDIKGLFL